MNRASKIYLIALVWIAAILQLFVNSKINHEKVMVKEAMAISDSTYVEGNITAYGYYGDEKMDANQRTQIVENFARKLGIKSDYDIDERSTRDGIVTALIKKGEQADSSIKIICMNNGENYLYTEITFKNSASEMAYDYKSKLIKLYKGLGVEAVTNLYLKEKRMGELTKEEEDIIIEEFLRNFNAQEVLECDIEGTTVVYGYSKDLDEFVYQDDKKVNVNIAIKYNLEEGVSYIYTGIPFVDKSF